MIEETVGDGSTAVETNNSSGVSGSESNFKKWIKLLATWEFAMEFLILSVHPIPYYEREYFVQMLDMLGTKSNYIEVRYMLGDFLFAFMLLRVYFLVRTLMNLNLYSELSSKRICGKHEVVPGHYFCIKALIDERPGSTVLLTGIISVLWLAYVLRIFER